MYKRIELDNGLKIIAHHMPHMQSLAMGIWINIGGRYESSANKGISHFLEHMLFKGSRKYSCRRIKESIEGVGGSLNGFTAEELTCYLVKIPADHASQALGVLSDMVINPALPLVEIEKEKPVILEEIKMYKDQPQNYVHDLLDELLWPGQALGEPIIGTVNSVKQVTREELSSFKKRHYTAPNIVVSAAGFLDYNKLAAQIARAFASLNGKYERNVFVKAKEAQKAPQIKILDKDTEQTHLALGFHGFKRDHSLRHALGLLNIILGANMSSRLFNELREKRGLAYEIGTHAKRLKDTGSFVVHAGIDNRKVPEAIRLILKELKKIKTKPVDPDEFRRAREFYTGQLKLALEDTLDHMLWIGETTTTLDKIYTLPEIIAEVEKVKREDLRTVARAIFKEVNLNLALIGPLKGMERDIREELDAC